MKCRRKTAIAYPGVEEYPELPFTIATLPSGLQEGPTAETVAETRLAMSPIRKNIHHVVSAWTTSLSRQLSHTISPNQNFKSFNIIYRR